MAADYGTPGPNQLARLNAAFPGGVCDWSKPGVGQGPLAGTWQSFGPDRPAAQSRKLRLRVDGGGGRSAKALLIATLEPCPEASRQLVTFERRVRGKSRKLGSAYAEGRRCRAILETRLHGGKRVRATSKRGPGYESARDSARAR